MNREGGRVREIVPIKDPRNLRQTNRKFSVQTEQVRGSPVKFDNPSSLVRVTEPAHRRLLTPSNLILAIGCALIVLPTMFQVARDTWSTEQGATVRLCLRPAFGRFGAN